MDKRIVIHPNLNLNEIFTILDFQFCNEYLYVHISRIIYEYFEIYGNISKFLINVKPIDNTQKVHTKVSNLVALYSSIGDKKSKCSDSLLQSDLYMYYVVEYETKEITDCVLKMFENIDYVIDFISFDITVTISHFDLSCNDDLTIYHLKHKKKKSIYIPLLFSNFTNNNKRTGRRHSFTCVPFRNTSL